MKSSSINKFVTFRLGDTRFGVDVLKTKEIVEYDSVTPVPEAPDFVDGVINMRGSVVPIIDLQQRFFGIRKENKGKDACSIIIVEPEIEGELTKIGLIVDGVQDVLEIREERLEPPPRYGSRLKSEYLLNVASLDNGFVLILDIDKIMSQIDLPGDFKAQDATISR